MPRLLALLGDVAGKTVLDLGCGEGGYARELARRGAAVTGVDGSARLIQVARERASPSAPPSARRLPGGATRVWTATPSIRGAQCHARGTTALAAIQKAVAHPVFSVHALGEGMSQPNARSLRSTGSRADTVADGVSQVRLRAGPESCGVPQVRDRLREVYGCRRRCASSLESHGTVGREGGSRTIACRSR
jgi:SAM-dependent methyltransferase